MKTKYEYIELPAYWASYLINADKSGYVMEELGFIDAELSKLGIRKNSFACTMEDEEFIGRYDGEICTMLTYAYYVE